MEVAEKFISDMCKNIQTSGYKREDPNVEIVKYEGMKTGNKVVLCTGDILFEFVFPDSSTVYVYENGKGAVLTIPHQRR